MSRRISLLAALAALAVAAAGCGGSSSPQVASVVTTTATTTPSARNGASALVAFSRCMRANGVPSFPDPQQYAGGHVKLTIQQTEGSNPHFHAAMEACGHLLPQRGGQESAQQQRVQLADELSFARCMRAHGVARFPDPTAQGQLSVEMVQAQGIDVHSPQVLRVVNRCLPASHGALTAAKVRAAIANAGG